ncbi:phosphodiester glycosidase family protein [Streptomyces sp. NPDC085481]|uniref:phosphodiester glycosidase family protein n=1 Tax=Streptomyces sp. NPDC085481 TaxID=3365727 RepID=UPI0037CDD019
MTRNHRASAALAATVAALALTTSAAAAPAVEEPPSLLALNWVKTETVTVATGVTRTTWTEQNLDNRIEARVLQVVEIDPAASAVTLESLVGRNDAAPETLPDQLATVSTVAARHPYAGTNGGLFQLEPAAAGTTERNAVHSSATATDGVLHSSSCWTGGQGSNGAVIQYGIPYVTKLLTELKLTGPTGESIRVDDVNRNPGYVPHCARDAEDTKISTSPLVYTDTDEIVLFTDDYGVTTPKPGISASVPATADAGFEVVLDANGVVTDAHAGRGGTTVPAGGRVLQGIGTGAEWLRTHLVRDDRVTVGQKLRDVTLGRDIPLDASVDVVSSFHRLLKSGDIPAELPNSCSDTTKPGKDPAILICTDSRTALATNIKGNPVLVSLTAKTGEDGDYLRTFAALLDSKELALVDALNLDGGGSTTLMTGTQVLTPPTDTVGGVKVHRKVADAVYAGVGGYGMYAK